LILQANATGDPTLDLIERIAKHPIYATELYYMRDRLMTIEVRRLIVPIYTTILSAASQHSKPLPVDDLMILGRQLSNMLAANADSSGSLNEISGEVGHVVSLVQSINNAWNTVRTRGSEPAALTRDVNHLERILRSARHDHCSALTAHDAPAECSNAA
jgi:hypothetical protein